MIRVLIADDHAIVRAGLQALLSAQPDIEVVGEAQDGREALEQVARLQPDVLLLDLSMDLLNGVETIKRLGEAHAHTRVLVLSMHATADYVRPAARAGAFGYLVKGAGLKHLLEALRCVAAGEHFWSPTVAHLVAAPSSVPSSQTELDRLTPREREVLQLVAEGRTNREIAVLLGLSPKTIDTHRTKSMQKLDLHDTPAVTRFAIRCGLISAHA